MNTHKSASVAAAAAVAVAAAVATYMVWQRTHSTTAGGGARRGDAGASSSGANTAARSVVGGETAVPAVPRVPGEPALEDEERARAMELLGLLKQRANLAFQEGRYEDAIRGYQDCISVTSALGSRDVEAVSAEQVIRSNVVMALIKLHQYEDARLVATMLLQDVDAPLSGDLQVKVLFRRGMASKALGDREAAASDFNAAVQLSPGQKNPAAEKELAILKKTS